MATASSLSLVLSLVFGIGQLVVGVGVTRWVLAARRWRRPNLFVLLLLALWFACSGAAELFVSGMESLHVLTSWPQVASFTLWRARADAALLAVTVALVVALIAYPAAQVMARRRGPHDAGPGKVTEQGQKAPD
jgi:hypothetical protein